MQFINAVVSTPADDIDFKIHLRNEFMRCGLEQVLPVKCVCSLPGCMIYTLLNISDIV